ncbi:MAG: hydantoinase/oxoprolinase family protein, partial [Pseudomonadota bacterium]
MQIGHRDRNARVHTVENGRDISGFTMVAFGGGAPLHAARQCEKLGIAACLIPPGAGVGSAWGFLRAPVSYVASRGLYQALDSFDPKAVNGAVEAMEAEARGFVTAGAPGAETDRRLVAQMRYRGQGWEIPVDLPLRAFSVDDAETLRMAFEAAYEDLFGRKIQGLAPEVTNWTLEVATRTPPPAPITRRLDGPDAPVTRYR